VGCQALSKQLDHGGSKDDNGKNNNKPMMMRLAGPISAYPFNNMSYVVSKLFPHVHDETTLRGAGGSIPMAASCY